jgi:hypothetical protein
LLFLLVISCDKSTDPEVNPALRVQADSIKVNAFSLSLDSATVDTSGFSITNVGEGRLDWTVSRDQPWIVVYPDRGNTVAETDQVEVYVDVEGLTGGRHTATVSVISGHGVVDIPVEVFVPIWTGKLTLSLLHFELSGDLDWTLRDTVTVDFYFEIDSNGIDAVGSGQGYHAEDFELKDTICQLVGIQSEIFDVGISGMTDSPNNRISLSFSSADLRLNFNLDCSDSTYDTSITFYEVAETDILNQIIQPDVPFFDGGFFPLIPTTDSNYPAWGSVPDIRYNYKVIIYKNED